jgi:predicted  nucleic acid-binding Zn-ribbon protein
MRRDENPVRPNLARMNTVLQDLAALLELQRLDLDNLELRKTLQGIPENIEETRRNVAHIGEILEKERQRVTDAEVWRRERERDVAIQGELLGKSKAKLQAARNEKENKAAQREIDTIRRTIQEREKEVLQVMEVIEQCRVAIAEHSDEFAQLEVHLKAVEDEGRVRMAEVEQRIGETSALRAELAGRVPAPLLKQYERLHNRIGIAVVEAADGKCTGCHMNLPPQQYNELMRGDKLFTCPACVRILVYRKPASEEPEAGGAGAAG